MEKSLELLDKVLSEFEEEQENSPAGEPESPSQGHQSEDDGYMSLNSNWRRYATSDVMNQIRVIFHFRAGFLLWLGSFCVV